MAKLFRFLPCFSVKSDEKDTSGVAGKPGVSGVVDSTAEGVAEKTSATVDVGKDRAEDVTDDLKAAATGGDVADGIEGVVHLKDEEVDPSEGSAVAVADDAEAVAQIPSGLSAPGMDTPMESQPGDFVDEAMLGTSAEAAGVGMTDGEMIEGADGDIDVAAAEGMVAEDTEVAMQERDSSMMDSMAVEQTSGLQMELMPAETSGLQMESAADGMEAAENREAAVIVDPVDAALVETAAEAVEVDQRLMNMGEVPALPSGEGPAPDSTEVQVVEEEVRPLAEGMRTISRVQQIQEQLLARDEAAALEPRLVKTRTASVASTSASLRSGTLGREASVPNESSDMVEPLSESGKTKSRIEEIHDSLLSADAKAKAEPRLNKPPSSTVANPIFTM